MAQPDTFLLDSTAPTFQDLAFQAPIYWTLNRTYSFALQTKSSGTNKAQFYKSLDGGITWTAPDSANATTSNGEAVYFWDGSTKTCNIAILPSSSGSQSLVLQDFDLDAETYSATYGAAGSPTGVFHSLGSINRMADGSLVVFYEKIVSGIIFRGYCAIFSSGAWIAVDIDIEDNVGSGVTAPWQGAIPDPASNLCHVFFSGGTTYYYRQIQSDGTLGAITTFPAGWNLHAPNLNFGRTFNTGYLRSGNLYIPVFTRDPITSIISLAEITGSPSSAPAFTISAAIDSGANANVGQDPGQAIGLYIGTTDYVAYFIGDGTNKYNLIKLASNSGSGWSTVLVYDATADPNAQQSPFNQQWLNTISATVDPANGFQYQFATWHVYPGDQNLTILSTEFSGSSDLALGCGNPPVGQLGQNYSCLLDPSGGTPPYSFAIIAGALPPGISLDLSTGLISGSPSALGLYTYTVQVTDSLAATGSVVCSINIVPALPPGTVVGGTGCLPYCVDPCKPWNDEKINRLARVLARGAFILAGGGPRRGC